MKIAALYLALTLSSALAQQAPVPLWNHLAPESHASAPDSIRTEPSGERVVTHVDQPSITPYLPLNPTGAAVLIIPGGGHREIWADHEGQNVAAFLTANGVAAFVLKYRLAREPGATYTIEGTELGDVQRALRLIRAQSHQWHIDPNRLGVLGFSAGGELAALAATRADHGNPTAPDPIDHLSSQPSFQALIYPALPKDPRLTPQTPPAFLACGALDREDISQGLATYYLALARLHVSAELHIFANTGHGFGIRPTNKPPVADWPQLFLEWMASQSLLKRP